MFRSGWVNIVSTIPNMGNRLTVPFWLGIQTWNGHDLEQETEMNVMP